MIKKSTFLNKTAISREIFAYTNLNNTDKNSIEPAIKQLFKDLKDGFEVYVSQLRSNNKGNQRKAYPLPCFF